jgi:hypothetical protein
MKPVEVNHTHLLKRMMELRDWAEYIETSVTTDQSYEVGKQKLLHEFVEPRLLQDVQARARVLQVGINRVIERLRQGAVNSEKP